MRYFLFMFFLIVLAAFPQPSSAQFSGANEDVDCSRYCLMETLGVSSMSYLNSYSSPAISISFGPTYYRYLVRMGIETTFHSGDIQLGVQRQINRYVFAGPTLIAIADWRNIRKGNASYIVVGPVLTFGPSKNRGWYFDTKFGPVINRHNAPNQKVNWYYSFGFGIRQMV